MTGATQMTESALKNVRFRAADWLIERVETESWTSETQAEFDAWLAESPANLLAFWRAEDSWKRAGLIGELYSPPTRLVRSNPTWRVMRKATGFVAAIAVVIVGAIFLLGAPQVETYSTPVGGQKTIALSDGSKIELNTNTELQFDPNNQRKVTLLRGEAYFRIKHDSSHPFVVVAAGRRITDLGTEFSIRNDASRIEVALVKGRARVDQKAGWSTRSAILMPGDVAVATANTVSIVRKQIRELEAALSWRQGLLVFHHTTLAEAAAQFNRYNREKLVIGDSSTAREEIRGTFRANDAAAFANMAKVVMGLQIENHGDEIVLSR